MKKEEFIRYLRSHGCVLLREGDRHSGWHNPRLSKRSAVPRHPEIKDILVKKICQDLGIPPVK